MIHWAFAAVALGGVVMATFVTDIRRATLALWVAGLGIGGVYLTLGGELLGIVQWIVSTLVTIAFMFFSSMFGEYGPSKADPLKKRLLTAFLALVLGLSFAAVVWLGSGNLPESMLTLPTEGNDLAALGKSLTEDHLLSLEVLALTLFLVLVGGGVIARPEGGRGDKAEGETGA